MKRIIILIILQLWGFNALFSQNLKDKTTVYTIDDYKGKTYIFDQNQIITESNAVGKYKTRPTTAYKGSRFTVEHVDSLTGELTIKFLPWKPMAKKNTDTLSYSKLKLNNRLTYNYKQEPGKSTAFPKDPTDNTRYFSMTNGQAYSSISAYVEDTKWNISLGMLTTPFKLRPTNSIFTSNLNLGTAISVQYKVNDDFAWGGIMGISVSSITMDSASTKGHVITTTDRPALTPSINSLISYKNINVTLGVGIDYINKTTVTERSWIYNGKPWIGFGIGVSLFNSTGSNLSSYRTKPIDGQ